MIITLIIYINNIIIIVHIRLDNMFRGHFISYKKVLDCRILFIQVQVFQTISHVQFNGTG